MTWPIFANAHNDEICDRKAQRMNEYDYIWLGAFIIICILLSPIWIPCYIVGAVWACREVKLFKRLLID